MPVEGAGGEGSREPQAVDHGVTVVPGSAVSLSTPWQDGCLTQVNAEPCPGVGAGRSKTAARV